MEWRKSVSKTRSHTNIYVFFPEFLFSFAKECQNYSDEYRNGKSWYHIACNMAAFFNVWFIHSASRKAIVQMLMFPEREYKKKKKRNENYYGKRGKMNNIIKSHASCVWVWHLTTTINVSLSFYFSTFPRISLYLKRMIQSLYMLISIIFKAFQEIDHCQKY